eukprot:2034889-Amphidinium_carterae.2
MICNMFIDRRDGRPSHALRTVIFMGSLLWGNPSVPTLQPHPMATVAHHRTPTSTGDLYTYIFGLDRMLEGSLAALATPAVGHMHNDANTRNIELVL